MDKQRTEELLKGVSQEDLISIIWKMTACSREDCYFERLCREYRGQNAALEHYDIRRIAQEYFTFWGRYRDTLLLMHRCGLDQMLYFELSRASGAVVKARISGRVRENDRETEYFAEYSTGGFSLLLQRWIAEGMEKPAEQYAQAVSQALLKFIGTATK